MINSDTQIITNAISSHPLNRFLASEKQKLQERVIQSFTQRINTCISLNPMTSILERNCEEIKAKVSSSDEYSSLPSSISKSLEEETFMNSQFEGEINESLLIPSTAEESLKTSDGDSALKRPAIAAAKRFITLPLSSAGNAVGAGLVGGSLEYLRKNAGKNLWRGGSSALPAGTIKDTILFTTIGAANQATDNHPAAPIVGALGVDILNGPVAYANARARLGVDSFAKSVMSTEAFHPGTNGTVQSAGKTMVWWSSHAAINHLIANPEDSEAMKFFKSFSSGVTASAMTWPLESQRIAKASGGEAPQIMKSFETALRHLSTDPCHSAKVVARNFRGFSSAGFAMGISAAATKLAT